MNGRAMTLAEEAISEGRGEFAFSLDRPGGGLHRHAFRVKRIVWEKGEPGEHEGYYLEFEEPGACGCVRRVDLAVLTHALMNMTPEEIDFAEARAVCAGCGHKHHADDVGFGDV